MVPIGFGAVCAALLVSSLTAARAAEGTTIHLRYVTVEDRLRPDPAPGRTTEREITAHLSTNGTVSEVYGRSFGHQHREDNWGGRLGGEGSSDVHWRVVDANTLVRTRDLAQSVQTITVHVRGSSCDMAFNDRFKPGFKEVKNYRLSDNSVAYYSLASVTQTSCTIE
jgi:hypothetical protein